MTTEDIISDPAVARARELVRACDDDTLAEQLELVRIPAPPFGEERRAEHVERRFRALGLADVCIDAEGNVLGRLPESGQATEPVILSAHLDTVFPEETDLDVRREEGRIAAPGIADNARGLAALLTVARTLAGNVRTRHPLVFAATVGEEGRGDLRGAKHLFREDSPWREAAAFIALDGTGADRIVRRALGSRRFRATLRGPGGHSWADWGTANPAHALGGAIDELADIPLGDEPRTTLTVGRLGGGTSINAIPERAWLELDLRSTDADALAELETRVRDVLGAAANGADRRGDSELELGIELVGDRPTGVLSESHPLVRAARAATREIGRAPKLATSSTDANVPIALGIPAIALGAGGRSGGTHTTDEWYENAGGAAGIERALLVAVGMAGVG